MIDCGPVHLRTGSWMQSVAVVVEVLVNGKWTALTVCSAFNLRTQLLTLLSHTHTHTHTHTLMAVEVH